MGERRGGLGGMENKWKSPLPFGCEVLPSKISRQLGRIRQVVNFRSSDARWSWLRRLLGIPPNLSMAWAGLLNRPDVLILDTETTGTSNRSEVVDIALIDTCGHVVYEGLVLPQGSISRDASDVHGLTRQRLKSLGAKPWPEHHASFVTALPRSAVFLAYNIEFDIRLINQTAERCNMQPLVRPVKRWDEDLSAWLFSRPSPVGRLDLRCLMLEYAAWRKVPHEWREGEWKWHTLEAAYAREVEGRHWQDHRALADCRMALALMRAVAERDPMAGVFPLE